MAAIERGMHELYADDPERAAACFGGQRLFIRNNG